MRTYAAFAPLLLLAMLCGCARTVLVTVPPRMELDSYGMLGIIEFASNSDRAIDAHATRMFQEHIHAAQPGTRFIELANREAVLAAVGAQQFDMDALKRIGKKYGVDAVFFGDITYSEPKADVTITDLARLEGRVRAEIRGDISTRLVETRTGASVWSNSAWATRQIGRVSVSPDHGVSAKVSQSNPHEEMLQALVYQLTHDFRPTSARQPVQ